MTATGTFDPQEVEPREGTEWFVATGRTVKLQVAPSARFLVESYPYLERKEQRDGSLVVKLGVSSDHWLGRLLIRGGTGIEVLEGDVPTNLRATTASQVLSRYSR